MTSALTGAQWMREQLDGHPIRSINNFRLEPNLLLRLCRDLSFNYGLKASGNISVVEKVGIFLFTLAKGASNRDVGDRFQRSGDTISRVFHEVLNTISSRQGRTLAHDIIRPRDKDFRHVPTKIAGDERYMPYFQDCIGCIDGTHIAACIPESDQMPYRGRKGYPTFNVMGVCDFDMCFTFVSAGWEGSAHDTRVFIHATQTPEMKFPHPPKGKYYLVDKGYPHRDGYMVPYSRIRYHKSQFENQAPQNFREYFNFKHSSLRSCIERCFGVLKNRWRILRLMPSFAVETQIHIIVATMALHNYIRLYSLNDPLFKVLDEFPDFIPQDVFGDPSNLLEPSSSNILEDEGYSDMKMMRDSIARALWLAK